MRCDHARLCAGKCKLHLPLSHGADRHDLPMQIREGLYYNPYFIGGAIAMPKMLADGGTEYDDGTVATESQQAKVSHGLCMLALP